MWENPKEVRGRERRVQEKANPRPGQVRAEHRGQEEEMIIVDPDALIAPRLLDDGVTEALIDLHVRRPLRLVIPHVRLKQMQQGPEGAVTHPIIIVSDVARAQEHGYTLILLPELALQALPGRRGPEGFARPAHPEAVAFGMRAR
jgi:hypothetical protein